MARHQVSSDELDPQDVAAHRARGPALKKKKKIRLGLLRSCLQAGCPRLLCQTLGCLGWKITLERDDGQAEGDRGDRRRQRKEKRTAKRGDMMKSKEI